MNPNFWQVVAKVVAFRISKYVIFLQNRIYEGGVMLMLIEIYFFWTLSKYMYKHVAKNSFCFIPYVYI